MTKCAECTHCGKQIVWNDAERQWEHAVPTTGLKRIACYVLQFAAPRRGSIFNR